jgi:mannose-6-phosphate isomerase-like protein (cupin superfamily)
VIAAAAVVMSAEALAHAQTPPAARRGGTTLTVSVTDGTGGPVHGARIVVTGPVNREGTTIADGTIRVTGLRAGAYRIRAEHVRFVTLERDITIRAGQQPPVEMTLSDAPPPPEPEPVAPPQPQQGQADSPPGEPRVTQITALLDKAFIGGTKETFREDEIGCTASARTTLLQVIEPTKEVANPVADEVLFAVSGEGTVRLGNTDVPFSSKRGTVTVIPRGTVRALSRKGREVLTVLSVVSGPSCTAKPTE